jgi:hypothetical protein
LNNTNQQNPIIVVACPGLCRTNMGKDLGVMIGMVDGLWKKCFARSAEQGSRELVSGTLLGPEAHGRFWSNDVLDERLPSMSTEVWTRAQKQSWSEIKGVLSKQFPKVSEIVGNA